MGPSTAPFPPGTGGGEDVAYGRKGKGILIHSLTDAAGMPLANLTTSATGNGRVQVLPLLDAIHLRTGKGERPRKRPSDRAPPQPEWAPQWEVAQRMDVSLLGAPGRRAEGALRWLVADPRIATAIVGITQRAHLQHNIAAIRQAIAPAVRQHLRDSYWAIRYPSGPLP
jgi:hypothetical protein